MAVLLVTDERFVEHDTGRHHPECPERLAAVIDGIDAAHYGDDVVPAAPKPAPIEQVVAVHDPGMVERAKVVASLGGDLDPDTPVVPASWEAALLAAGAGLVAVDALTAGAADAAFCAVRPPGHHATPHLSMGFCVLNNVAVTARTLADAGERVAILDVDAHHGNGTQDAFWSDPRVLFVSWHQSPLYPGSGRLDDVGGEGAEGTTLNFPMPPGSTGDHYRRLIDDVVAPALEAFDASWVLISAGFDAHRDDPLTSLGLTSGDYADILLDLLQLAPAHRTITFLEGGYDLAALGRCSAATVGALLGDRRHDERPSSGGPGGVVVDRIADFHLHASLD